jgi:hypothetical protein
VRPRDDDPSNTIPVKRRWCGDGGSTIHVKASHPLISQIWYAPEVKVTNSSDSPITITSAELITRRETYANKTARPGTYPVVIQPGSTETLDVGFHLNDDVKKTFFQQSVELRFALPNWQQGGDCLHYR